MDWAPPAGDGGGYDKGDEEHGGYGYGGSDWDLTSWSRNLRNLCVLLRSVA